ncbi:MAG: amidohydrolase [Steroidobacteraceae bacterium]
MKPVLHVRSLALFLLMLPGTLPSALAQDADVLFVGGTIITVDPQQPQTEAMLIRKDRIVAIGARAQLEHAYPKARRHDLQGHTVLPGIIDSHAHAYQLGQDRRKAVLNGTRTVDEMVARLKAFYPNPAPGEWLVGAGWDEGLWATLGYPDRAALDKAFPRNPVRLESLHGFAGFYNGRALDIAGINATTPDPQVGQILRRADGNPTGVLLTLAQQLVTAHVPAETLVEMKKNIVTGLTALAQVGVTSVHEAGIPRERVAAFRALAAAGQLPIRVYGMLDGNDVELMKEWYARGPLIDPQAWLTIRAVKIYYDGSLGSRTALLAQPYADQPEAANMTERIAPATVASLATHALTRGFQLATHAIGDEANDRVLNIYSGALAAHPATDHRWRIEHAQVVLPDYYARAATLGVISSMQSSHAVGDSNWAEARLGPTRIRYAYAWRRVLDAGASLLINSDLPGEPWEPMQTLYFAVTRKPLAGGASVGWYADQALSVGEAISAMTLAGAYGAFQEQQLGSLTPGKFADFIELDRDPRQVPPDDLKSIRVLRTWIAGKLVARRK